MPINVITGAPGTAWRNDTGKVAYQFQVNWSNTCGLCAQFDGTIRATSWPIPLHYGCKCKQSLVYPDAIAKPFVNFRETIRNLDPAQRNAVVGATNYRLIEAGIVKWEDVVTASRIRDLTEVVSLKGLSLSDLSRVGVTSGRAQRLIAAANTPAERLADESRRRILAALEARGVQASRVRELVASRLASRVAPRRGGGEPGVTTTATPTPAPPASPTPQAPVKFAVRDRAAYEQAWRATLGRVPSDADAAALAGAPPGAEVRARGRDTDTVVIAWDLPGVATAARSFYRDASGKLTIHAAFLEVQAKERGKGLGREVFGAMVDAGQRLGFDQIITHAAKSGAMVGYKVWPRFGYDAPLPPSTIQGLPPELSGARRLSDLMTSEQGRAWWNNHGGGVNLTFDLKPDSLSMKTWKAYQAAKTAISAATNRTSRRRTKP